MLGAIKIVPAILTEDPGALESMVRQAESFTDYVQFDIMDGRFVPNISFGSSIAADIVRASGLPCCAHLMIKHPEEAFDAGIGKPHRVEDAPFERHNRRIDMPRSRLRAETFRHYSSSS
jgi:pentose-5-phosphate-3-epimerase